MVLPAATPLITALSVVLFLWGVFWFLSTNGYNLCMRDEARMFSWQPFHSLFRGTTTTITLTRQPF